MKKLLTIGQLSVAEIEEILELSLNTNDKILSGKNVLFAFEKPSLRTKLGTEVAINQLGGNIIHVEAENFFEGNVLFSKKEQYQLEGRESLKDTVKNVEQWCDAIFARVFSHNTLLEIDQIGSIPVVNALCDQHHPMQALADLMTVKEVFFDQKITITFIGDANNVAFSLFEVMLKFGHRVQFAGPEKFSFTKEQEKYFKSLGDATFSNSLVEVTKDADIIYTDTFVSMGEEEEFEEKIKSFEGYQVNKKLLGDAYFMHCLPAHRGVEASDEVMDSAKSLVYQQAKNRMVVAKGVFTKLLTQKS